jgi:hypothetical protein
VIEFCLLKVEEDKNIPGSAEVGGSDFHDLDTVEGVDEFVFSLYDFQASGALIHGFNIIEKHLLLNSVVHEADLTEKPLVKVNFFSRTHTAFTSIIFFGDLLRDPFGLTHPNVIRYLFFFISV